MAINIFQGAASKKSPNKASNTTRAQEAKQALAAPAEVSNSGTTAVKTGGTLSKVGNFIGKAAGIASKFLPGLGGTIAGAVSNLLNDPEWWQSVPGNALTLNNSLRLTPEGDYNTDDWILPAYQLKAAIAEFYSTTGDIRLEVQDKVVLYPTENMITQYLMPQIRKVVNAIPLQAAANYQEVIAVQATLYALWRNLKKYDYMLKHGTTYIPNLNVGAFPVFQVSNAAWLQSTINRLEEYLRANVRLPHTLCEYLAWRYGRVYKSNASAKSGIILHDVLPLNTPIALYDGYIGELMSYVSGSVNTQAANTDLYNTYFDHDYQVEIRDDTQFSYDFKEFMLRTNCDILNSTIEGGANVTMNTIVVDSSMDNPTTFMASSVSTQVNKDAPYALIPVRGCRIWVYIPESKQVLDLVSGNSRLTVLNHDASGWSYATITEEAVTTQGSTPDRVGRLLYKTLLCKSLDLYNKGLYVTMRTEGDNMILVDATALSIDSGTVTDAVIETEQVYAFANLVDIDRKHSLSYAKAEKLVARDTANLIDTMDIATAKTA